MSEEERVAIRRQDEHFLEQVRKLAGMARSAREEAEQYASEIDDPILREEAEKELEKE